MLETPKETEKLEGIILETPAIDYLIEPSITSIFTDRTKLIETRVILEKNGYAFEKVSFEYIPKNYTSVTDTDNALKIYKMLEAFSEDEDVEVVWNNADISDALWAEVEAKVESTRFRT
jgi:transcriptional/translational regulatory protein YebC/TACO1